MTNHKIFLQYTNDNGELITVDHTNFENIKSDKAYTFDVMWEIDSSALGIGLSIFFNNEKLISNTSPGEGIKFIKEAIPNELELTSEFKMADDKIPFTIVSDSSNLDGLTIGKPDDTNKKGIMVWLKAIDPDVTWGPNIGAPYKLATFSFKTPTSFDYTVINIIATDLRSGDTFHDTTFDLASGFSRPVTFTLIDDDMNIPRFNIAKDPRNAVHLKEYLQQIVASGYIVEARKLISHPSDFFNNDATLKQYITDGKSKINELLSVCTDFVVLTIFDYVM